MNLFDVDEATRQSNEKISKNSRIKELEELIVRYQNSYYNGESEIPDEEFDKLWDELKTLDKANPILHKVGADSGNFEKAPHVMPMGSQEKAASPEEFLDWAEKHIYPEYLVEYKLDGASLELQYNEGKLLRAVTRGNGTIGDVITSNALKMNGVQSEIHFADGKLFNFTGGIRGEVIMTHKVHQEKFKDKANCRNAANGIMKRKDGEGSENLCLIVYDIWSTTGIQPFEDEVSKLEFLTAAGFNTVPLKICSNTKEVISYREQVMDLRKDLDYDIDGLVIKERTVNHEDASRTRPDRQIAFKFSLEEAVTTLRQVEWNENGATYTPVGIFDSVRLNGTTVKRASLVHPNLIRNLGVQIGIKVVVVKRGEIIPKIISVLPSDNQQTTPVEIPHLCSTCKTELIDEGTRLFCPNKSCPKRILHQLLKWVQVIDIRDLGEALITSMFNDKILNSISDIYKLNVQSLTPYFLNEESISQEKESLGAQKVFSSIQNHRKLNLNQYIAGFDIEGIGEGVVDKLISAGYNTVEKILNATEEEIAEVYGFAQTLAHSFVYGIKENKAEILSLIESGVIEINQQAEGKLTGLSFCFTGELNTMKRLDAQNIVKNLGGTVKSSVVKGLSYLVTNDTSSGSSKNVKAAQLGIPVITEIEFIELTKK